MKTITLEEATIEQVEAIKNFCVQTQTNANDYKKFMMSDTNVIIAYSKEH